MFAKFTEFELITYNLGCLTDDISIFSFGGGGGGGGGLMILIIAVLNWEIPGNALRDDSKLFHSLTQKGYKLLEIDQYGS